MLPLAVTTAATYNDTYMLNLKRYVRLPINTFQFHTRSWLKSLFVGLWLVTVTLRGVRLDKKYRILGDIQSTVHMPIFKVLYTCRYSNCCTRADIQSTVHLAILNQDSVIFVSNSDKLSVAFGTKTKSIHTCDLT